MMAFCIVLDTYTVPWKLCFTPVPVLNRTNRLASNSEQLLAVSSRGVEGDSKTVPYIRKSQHVTMKCNVTMNKGHNGIRSMVPCREFLTQRLRFLVVLCTEVVLIYFEESFIRGFIVVENIIPS